MLAAIYNDEVVEEPTDDKRNHRGAISSGGLQTLDQFFNLPYFDILLRFIRLGRAHVGRHDDVGRPGG